MIFTFPGGELAVAEGVTDLPGVLVGPVLASRYGQHESEWAAMAAVAEALGVGTPETVRKWVRQTEIDQSYDNALAETINGPYKTELIKPCKPWRTVEQVELATAEWVDWFNHRRLYEHCGDIPPAELEAAYYAHHRAQPTAELTHR